MDNSANFSHSSTIIYGKDGISFDEVLFIGLAKCLILIKILKKKFKLKKGKKNINSSLAPPQPYVSVEFNQYGIL